MNFETSAEVKRREEGSPQWDEEEERRREEAKRLPKEASPSASAGSSPKSRGRTVLRKQRPGPKSSKRDRSGASDALEAAVCLRRVEQPGPSGRTRSSSSGVSRGSYCTAESSGERDRPLHGGGGKRGPPNSVEVSSDEETLSASSSVSRKRGPGRPATTGEFVGLAAAKERKARATVEEADARVVQAMATMTCRATSAFSKRRDGIVEGVPLADLISSMGDAIDAVLEVCRVSKGLKGTAIKSLKTAASVIRAGTDELGLWSQASSVRGSRMDLDTAGAEDQENLALRAANKLLEEQLREVREELRMLKLSTTSSSSPPADSPREDSGSWSPPSKRGRTESETRTEMPPPSTAEVPKAQRGPRPQRRGTGGPKIVKEESFPALGPLVVVEARKPSGGHLKKEEGGEEDLLRRISRLMDDKLKTQEERILHKVGVASYRDVVAGGVSDTQTRTRQGKTQPPRTEGGERRKDEGKGRRGPESIGAGKGGGRPSSKPRSAPSRSRGEKKVEVEESRLAELVEARPQEGDWEEVKRKKRRGGGAGMKRQNAATSAPSSSESSPPARKEQGPTGGAKKKASAKAKVVAERKEAGRVAPPPRRRSLRPQQRWY